MNEGALNRFHFERLERGDDSAEAVTARREAHEAQAKLVVECVACSQCGAVVGQYCNGLKRDVVHFERGLAYAKTGGA